MIRFECDKCGVSLQANDAQRYIVKMEIFAAAGHIDLDSESINHSQSQLKDVLDKLATADPNEVEDQTYRSFRFDLCNSCRKNFIQTPLGSS